MKIGVMFGNPETTTGGNALKFYASVRLDVRRIEAIKDGTSIVGNRTRVKVVKNKVAPPFREAQFDILYNEGISRLGDLIDTAVEHNIIAKSGSWFSYKEDRIGQGRDAVKKFLQENEKTAISIDSETRKKLGLAQSGTQRSGNGQERTSGGVAGNSARPADAVHAAGASGTEALQQKGGRPGQPSEARPPQPPQNAPVITPSKPPVTGGPGRPDPSKRK
jgi:hypothetical protein